MIKKKKGKKKGYQFGKHSVNRFNRTGEDIEMLNERKQSQSSKASSSLSYKDHVDAA